MHNTNTDVLLDLETLRSAQSLMQGKFQKIIGYFLEDTRIYIDAIKEGLRIDDINKIIPAAHTIKSSSRQIGAEKLSDAALQLEIKAKDCAMRNENTAKITGDAQMVEDIFMRTSIQLEVAISEMFK